MPGKIILAVGQLGPVARGDSRERVVKRLVDMLEEAAARDTDFIVFPELALPGYILGDLWEFDTLVTDAPPPRDIATALAAAGVETIVAGPEKRLIYRLNEPLLRTTLGVPVFRL